jgi:hypothetical protein
MLINALVILMQVFISNQDLINIRNKYAVADKNKSNYLQFIQTINTSKEVNTPVKNAYLAASTMISSVFEINPISKLRNFNNGKDFLEKTIASANAELEVHYVRYTIQVKSPFILGYRDNLNEDKILLIANLNEDLKQKDPDLYSRVYQFLIQSEHISASEKQQLKLKKP